MSEPGSVSTLLPYPLLPPGMELHVCMTCGAAVAAKGVDIHEMWHRNASGASIEAFRRLDILEEVH